MAAFLSNVMTFSITLGTCSQIAQNNALVKVSWYPKIDFNTRMWYKIVIIITGIAKRQDVETTKIPQFGSGMS